MRSLAPLLVLLPFVAPTYACDDTLTPLAPVEEVAQPAFEAEAAAQDYHFVTKWGSNCIIRSGGNCVDPDGPGPLELGDGQFYSPTDVATDVRGNVYVADYNNDRIQVFAR